MEGHSIANAEVEVQLLPVLNCQAAPGLTDADVDACVRVLQRVADDPGLIDDNPRFKALVAKIHTRGKRASRARERADAHTADRGLRATSTVASKQVLTDANPRRIGPIDGQRLLSRPSRCYICKQPYTEVHTFYHLLCPTCAAFNYAKRFQRANLNGRTAIVTGGRIKIGFETALKLLRDGARVLVTTRFPVDCARRFASEADAVEWRDRLRIYALDLRNLPSVEQFANSLIETESSIDVIINNAAQTVKRPLAYYQGLLEAETNRTHADAMDVIVHGRESVLLETAPMYPNGDIPAHYFPTGIVDIEGQPLDLRPDNSWRLRLGEVRTIEMVETMLVNAAAPFILNSRLKPLMMNSPFERRFIVNVSAMEGQYARASKTANHPHTNMAKAALNMMTRTSAQDYLRDGIYMTSVDTGWITDENPYSIKLSIQSRKGFYAPLDVIDGASRIYDPIARGIAEPDEPQFGVFLKDYAPYEW